MSLTFTSASQLDRFVERFIARLELTDEHCQLRPSIFPAGRYPEEAYGVWADWWEEAGDNERAAACRQRLEVLMPPSTRHLQHDTPHS